MPRKAAIQVPSRAANKAARQDRRDEILDRWEARSQRHRNIEIFSKLASDDLELSQFIDYLLLVDTDIVDDPLLVRDQMLEARGTSDRQIIHSLVRIIQLKEMPYDEYLKTDEWRVVANRAKSEYYGRCALDETHTAQHAHHRTYVRRGRERRTDVIPLCRECHERFHNR